jgi:hypothetical protein
LFIDDLLDFVMRYNMLRISSLGVSNAPATLNSTGDYGGVCGEGLLACPWDRQQASIHVGIKADADNG